MGSPTAAQGETVKVKAKKWEKGKDMGREGPELKGTGPLAPTEDALVMPSMLV